ncbi:MAG: DUF3473 domain-containing protein [Candidatus Omnitrophica bacterium]|nr:DUF3473 domain-containing protein [Candidatus Omnitrophota bacterium]
MKNFLTFDLEEWHDTASLEGWTAPPGTLKVFAPATELILDAIRPFTATFFVLACHAKENAPLLRRIVREGHEIALHGLDHTSMSRYSPERFREEIFSARKILEDAAAAPVKGFRAPNFSMGEERRWAMDILFSCGFEYDSSMTAFVGRSYREEGSVRIREIPRGAAGPAELLPFGGGAFLRLYPYNWTRSWIKDRNARGLRAMVYAHPWEFDARWMQVNGLPWRAKVLMGTRLSSMGPKLSALIAEFKFGSVREIMQEELSGGKT